METWFAGLGSQPAIEEPKTVVCRTPLLIELPIDFARRRAETVVPLLFSVVIFTGIIAPVFFGPGYDNVSDPHYDPAHHHGGAHKDHSVHAQTVSPTTASAAIKAISHSISTMFRSTFDHARNSLVLGADSTL